MSAATDFGMPPYAEAERNGHLSALAEVAWLIASSEGVVMRAGQPPLPWSEVGAIFLPSWRDQIGASGDERVTRDDEAPKNDESSASISQRDRTPQVPPHTGVPSSPH